MNIEQFEDFAADGYNRIPVYRPVNLDIPFHDLVKLLIKPNRALLQFRDEHNHTYSALGLSATQVIQYQNRQIIIKKEHHIIKQFDIDTIPQINPLEWLSDYNSYFKTPRLSNLPQFFGGLIGYIGANLYEFTELHAPQIDSNELPDFSFMLCDDFLVINHDSNQVWLITYVDPIIRHVYQTAQDKLVELANLLTDELQSNQSPTQTQHHDINKTINHDDLTQLAKKHDFDFLTLYAQEVSNQDGFTVFNDLFLKVNLPAYFLHFENFYMFGFGRNSLKKFNQMLEVHYQPMIYPELNVSEQRYEHNKIVCQKSISSLCLEHSMGTTRDIICEKLPPSYSAVDAIKAMMPHPLQIGDKKIHSFLFAEQNPQNSWPQQRGLVGMLNWHDDFIGQFQFHSWLCFKGQLHYSVPFLY